MAVSQEAVQVPVFESGFVQGKERVEGRAHSQRPEAQFSLCSRLLSWRVIPSALHICGFSTRGFKQSWIENSWSENITLLLTCTM